MYFSNNQLCFVISFSASGTSAVAIDNKIEQAMVSVINESLLFIERCQSLSLIIICLRRQCPC